MRTTIDSYKERAGRLDLDGLDFDAFLDAPLSLESLRCLSYMHDIEHHTICYLRDLLLTPAHRDPEVTSFLACWAFEELWHGEAIGLVLKAHGIGVGPGRIQTMREKRRLRDAVGIATHLSGSSLVGRPFVALHMSWGVINEWSTQAGYARLSARAQHPVLSELLSRIMKQEGRHIDFYGSEATRRLSESTKAQRFTRFALKHFWRPVGSGLMPTSEVAFLVDYLFSDEEGRAATARIDRRIDRLPGLDGLSLMPKALERLSKAA